MRPDIGDFYIRLKYHVSPLLNETPTPEKFPVEARKIMPDPPMLAEASDFKKAFVVAYDTLTSVRIVWKRTGHCDRCTAGLVTLHGLTTDRNRSG